MSETTDTPDTAGNWEALSNFVQHFHIRADKTGLCSFDADVLFRSNRDVDERTHVYIDFHAGAVSPVRFAEKGELNPVFVHTEFRPAFSTFIFENEELHIIGKSPKVSRYIVRISPLVA
jgi:hypothetical protein